MSSSTVMPFVRYLLLLSAFFTASNVISAQRNFGVTAGVGYSDNIRRTANNPEDETLISAGINFSIQQDSKRLYADALADLAYVDYLNNTFDSEVVGNLAALVNFRIIPERFEWLFQDNFGQVRSDPFTAVTPGNRENINYFTTGPTFTAPLGTATRAQIAARYSNVNFQSSLNDSSRYAASLALIRDFSAASNGSINIGAERVQFDLPPGLNNDYDVRSAYLRYQITGARTVASIDVGYNELEFTNGEKSSGTLFRVELDRQMSPSSAFHMRLGREFTDAGNLFRINQELTTSNTVTQNTVQTANPFVNEYLSLGVSFARNRTAFGLQGQYSKETYARQSTFDRDRILASAQLSRELSRTFRAQLGVAYLREQFRIVSGGDFYELNESLDLSWQAGRRVAFTLQLQHFNRQADLGTTDYSENRAWLYLTYGQANVQSRQTTLPQNPRQSATSLQSQ